MGRKGSRSSNIVNSTPKECAGTDTTTKRSKAAEVAPDPGPSEEQITQSMLDTSNAFRLMFVCRCPIFF